MSFPRHRNRQGAIAFACFILLLVSAIAWSAGSILHSWPAMHPGSRVSAPAAPDSRVAVEYGKLDISFEANRGQTDKSVQFFARGAAYTLFLTRGTAVLSLRSAVKSAPLASQGPRSVAPAGPTGSSSTAIALQLVGSNPLAEASGIDPLPGKANYFKGADPAQWITDVPTYAKVRYHNIYAGIDLLYYGNRDGRVEHDFVVAPGADPEMIAIDVHNALEVLHEANGGIRARTQCGDITLDRPVAYQVVGGKRKIIEAEYALAGESEIGLRLGGYDKRLPLTIDPVLRYSAVLGGSRDEFAGGTPVGSSGLAIDSSGNAYVTGWTDSDDFPVVNGIQGHTTIQSAFVSKLNATGSALIYSTYLGGTLSEGTGIAVDSEGRAYVTGDSGPGLALKNAYQYAMAGGSHDAFVSVLNAAGDDLVYSTYLGGAGDDQSHGIALDPQNNAYITGSNGSSSSFPKFQSLQPDGPIFAAKFDPSGRLQYSSLIGEQTQVLLPSLPTGIAVDSFGHAYITGWTYSASFPTTINAMQKACPTCSSLGGSFAAKLGFQGNSLVYSTYLNHARSFAIAVDSSGNAYLGGDATAGFQLAGTPFQTRTDSAFVAKLNPSGSGFIFSTYLGGTNYDSVRALAVDQYRQVYVAGTTGSSDFPLKAPIQSYDGQRLPHRFVTTLSSSGSSIVYFSTYFGSGQTESSGSPFSIAVDKALNVYLAGTTEGSVLSTPGALSRDTSVMNWNAFVSKLVIMDDVAMTINASPSLSLSPAAAISLTR